MEPHYHLILPDELIDALRQIAVSRNTSMIDVLRRFIDLGLRTIEIEEQPGAALIVREEGKDEREITLFS